MSFTAREPGTSKAPVSTTQITFPIAPEVYSKVDQDRVRQLIELALKDTNAAVNTLGSTDVIPGTIVRFLDARLHAPGLVSGVDGISTLSGTTRFGGIGQSSFYTGPLFAYRAGAAQMLYQAVDGRRCLSPQPGAGAYSTAYLRPYALTGLTLFAMDFRATYAGGGALTSTPNAIVQNPMATKMSAWLRKKAAGDSSSCRFTFGFGDNTFLSPTQEIARIGIMGDGAGGYRFGSVNCPDGGGAVENAASDIDSGSIQPSEIAAPSTNWFHAAIKLVPPTPTANGFWTARLNGNLVKTFTSTANFPRGSGGTSYDYTRIEGLILTNESAVAVPLLHDVRVEITDDLTP